MKKITAIILSVIMMLSVTFYVYAESQNTSLSKIENYLDFLEEKTADKNTSSFMKFVLRLAMFGISLGLIDSDDFDGWFEDESTSDNTNNNNANDDLTVSNELSLHSSQSFPYIDKDTGVKINKISITKERYDGVWQNSVQTYKYRLVIEGSAPMDKFFNGIYVPDISLQFVSSVSGASEKRFYPLYNKNTSIIQIDENSTIDENGNFVVIINQYNMFTDYDIFYITDVSTTDIRF